MSRRSLAILVLAALLALALAACGSDDDDADGAALDPDNPVALQVGIIPIAAMTPLDVADKEGFFEERGLDVELVDMGQTDAIATLESGELDMALEIPGPALRANQQGTDVVAVFQNEIAHAEPPDSGGIVANREGDVDELADLAGTKVAVNSVGSQEVVSAERVMQEAGVNLDEVEFIEIPFPNQPDAVEQGQVDAAVMVDPFTTISQQAGFGEVLSYMYVEAVPEQPIGVFWSQREWAEENGDVVVAFDEAVSQAHELLNADEDEARRRTAEFSGLEPELVEAMPPIGWESDVDLARWDDLVTMLTEEGELASGLEPKDYLAEHILERGE